MQKFNAKNERIKRRYLIRLTNAEGKHPATAAQAADALALFEKSTGWKDFSTLHEEQALKFRRDLEALRNAKTGKTLARATIRSRLHAVKLFFLWLSDQPGYRSCIRRSDYELLSPASSESRSSTSSKESRFPSFELVRHVILSAPALTHIEKRDRALIAFALASGMRDMALATLPIGKVNIALREIDQDGQIVKTKQSKAMATFLFPVGEDVFEIIAGWVAYLKAELLFGDDDPLFPATNVRRGDAGGFEAVGLKREFWTNAGAIRRIFRERFEAAGLPYYHPHSLRHTLMQRAYHLNLGGEALKAWSQNLGHEKLDTSVNSYGRVSRQRTGEILANLANQDGPAAFEPPPPEVVAWMKKLTT